MIKPNLFIVGAPKCGTSALYEYLRQHPDVYMSPHKEPHFFGADLGFRPPRYIRDRTSYQALFDAAQEQRYAGEASTWYLFSSSAAREIHTFNPASKIIMMLRSPVDMIYSLYYHNLYVRNETLLSFEEALDAEPDRKLGRRIPHSTNNRQTLFYTEAARFSEQVKRYLEIFPPEQVHIIIYDDFQSDIAGEFSKVVQFLEINAAFQPTFERVNENKQVRNLRLHHFLSNPPPALVKLGQRVSPLAKPLYRKLRTSNVRVGPRPPMNPQARARLQALFTPEVEKLSALLNRDLTHWCKVEHNSR